MTINISELLWALINIFLIAFIGLLIYNIYKNSKKRDENQRLQNEIIIKQLDEVIEANKQIIQILSDRKNNSAS
ncbi:hypothetical protein [Dehalobacterium formicoaceticum]|uniref:Uncharacterized protein n=1 Tax=Dehalobacterium formicoaceticum TaxID=51515 RepID=A0ABT1Y3X8_9FIRM|nr:hypothetical protein [Dehalobacterium formicoaceticum]MCR6545273.1 hypothetical protein [Dehalobacterium formicoaceticum]